MSRETHVSSLKLFQQPVVGTALTILSGLSFLFVCMILPLVGRSGSAAPHADKNYRAFLGVLLLSLALGILAAISKIERRKIDGSPLPYLSLGLSGVCLVLLMALLTGLLSI